MSLKYENNTVEELKKLCKQNNISGYSKLNKKELIKLLKKNKKTDKKIHKGGKITFNLIPPFHDDIITNVQNNVEAGINKVEDFFGKLKQDYVYSVQKAASVKIGDQRLIQGGNKTKIENKSNKSDKSKK
jgi:hypothetical protein